MIMMWTGALKKNFFYILFLLINYLNLSQPSEMTLEEAKKRASVCVALALCDFFLLVQNLKPGKKEL